MEVKDLKARSGLGLWALLELLFAGYGAPV